MTHATLSPFEPVSVQVQISLFPPCTPSLCSAFLPLFPLPPSDLSHHLVSVIFYSLAPSFHLPPPSPLHLLCPPNSLLSFASPRLLPNLPPSIFPSKFSTLVCRAPFSSLLTVIAPLSHFFHSLPLSFPPHCPPISLLPSPLLFVVITMTVSIQPSSDKSGQRLTSQFIIHCLLATFPALVNTFFLCRQMLSTFPPFYYSSVKSHPFLSLTSIHSPRQPSQSSKRSIV